MIESLDFSSSLETQSEVLRVVRKICRARIPRIGLSTQGGHFGAPNDVRARSHFLEKFIRCGSVLGNVTPYELNMTRFATGSVQIEALKVPPLTSWRGRAKLVQA